MSNATHRHRKTSILFATVKISRYNTNEGGKNEF